MAASAARFATLLSACQTDRDPSDEHYKHVVVNLSFAIVPCAVFEGFAAVNGTRDSATFEDCVVAPLEVDEIAEEHLDGLGLLVSTPVAQSQDPFFDSLECPMPSFDGSLERCDGTSDESYWPKLKSLEHVAAPVASLFAAVDLLSEDRACDPGDLSIGPVTCHAKATTTLDGAPLVAGFGYGSDDDAASLFRSRE